MDRNIPYASTVLIGLALLIGSFMYSSPGAAQVSTTLARPRISAAALRLTVAPAANSPIEMTTIPNAECILHPAGDKTHSIHIYADEAGIIRFFVHPAAASGNNIQLVADCAAGPDSATYPIELRANASPTAEMPAPAKISRRAVTGHTLPALSKDEITQLSNQDLMKRGYPMRPSPVGAPSAYAGWLRAVSTQAIEVTARTRPSSEVREDYCHCFRPYPPVRFHVPVINRVLPALTEAEALSLSPEVLKARGYPVRPDKVKSGPEYSAWLNKVKFPISTLVPSNSPEGSNIWSGDELQEKAGAYDWVTGGWNVVSVTGETNTNTDSSTWIGIDGDGTNDLVQAGTEQEAFGTGNALVTTYRAWTEFLPQQGTESIITNFTVNPGDQMFVEVSMGSAGGSLSLSGPFGVFLVSDLTTGVSTYVDTPIGSTVVGGSEAEWVMERPTFGTTPADLADYNTGSIYWAYARRPNSARHQGYVNCCNGTTSVNITMSNNANGNVLSQASTPDADTVDFTWKAFK